MNPTQLRSAWHTLGATLPPGATAEAAMSHALLSGWNVRKAPLFAVEAGASKRVAVPNRYAVVRDSPIKSGAVDVLGTVGEAYQIIQNEEHAAVLNAIVEESGAQFETAGTLRGGAQVFITMRLPGHMRIGGADTVDTFIAATNAHDGSSAFTIMATPVRVVGQALLNLPLRNVPGAVRVRHSRSINTAVVDEARTALDTAFTYLDSFQALGDQLATTPMSLRAFEQVIHQTYGVAPTAPQRTATRTANKLDEMVYLFTDAHAGHPLQYTAWAGLNALVEWFDHYSPTRGADRDTARHTNAILDTTFKKGALRAIERYAGVGRR